LQQRLPDRNVERCHGSGEEGQQRHLPELDLLEPGQREQHQGEEHCGALGPEQGLAPRDPIGRHSRDQTEEQDRQVAQESDESEMKRRVGKAQDEPALGHELHPRPRERDNLAEPEQPKIPVPQRAKRARRDGQDPTWNGKRHAGGFYANPMRGWWRRRGLDTMSWARFEGNRPAASADAH